MLVWTPMESPPSDGANFTKGKKRIEGMRRGRQQRRKGLAWQICSQSQRELISYCGRVQGRAAMHNRVRAGWHGWVGLIGSVDGAAQLVTQS